MSDINSNDIEYGEDIQILNTEEEFINFISGEIPPGTRNSEGHLVASPPKEVRDVLKKILRPGKVTISETGALSSTADFADMSPLTASELEIINSFAAKVAGESLVDCRIVSLDGCGSCAISGIARFQLCTYIRFGNIVQCTDGTIQCWLCAIERDCVPGPDA